MKIKTKIFLSIISFMVITTIFGFVFIYLSEKHNKSFSNIEYYTLPTNQALNDIRFWSMRIVSLVNEYGMVSAIKTGSDEEVNEALKEEERLFLEGIVNLRSVLQDYESIVSQSSHDKRTLFDSLKHSSVILVKQGEELLDAIKMKKSTEAILEAKESFENAEKQFLNYVYNVLDNEISELYMQTYELKRESKNITNAVLLLMIFVVLVWLTISFFLVKYISVSIEKLNKMTSEISKGNFTFKIHTNSKDEFGIFIHSLNEMADKIRRNELALKESEANLNSLIDNRDESIWSVDKDYNYIIFNKFFEEEYFRTFNIRLKKGLNVLKILTPELVDFWKPKYDKAFSGERIIFEFYNLVGDEQHLYEVFLSPVFSGDKVTGVTGLSVDITERKKAEKVVLESRANMAAIIENTTDSIWAIDSSYNILYVNDIFKTAFFENFSVHLLVGVNLLEALPEHLRPIWKPRYDRALNNERFQFVDEIDIGTKIIYIEVSINPIVVNDKVVGTSFFGSDVTERKVAEKMIIENAARLHELNATKDKFFSIIGHDLKGPFNTILGFSELLLERVVDKNYEEVEKFAKIINKSSSNSMDLLTNLLEWSVSQSGNMDFNPEYFDIFTFINEVTEVLEDIAKQKSITISKSLPRSLPVFADKAMVNTIMRNLISNAIKFTNKGGEIIIGAEQKEDELIISVKDNGVGISKDGIEKLFRIDEGHSTLGTQNEKGTGLGLILCKEFVDHHEGKIWAESKTGKGSNFKFSLPLKT